MAKITVRDREHSASEHLHNIGPQFKLFAQNVPPQTPQDTTVELCFDSATLRDCLVAKYAHVKKIINILPVRS